MRKALIAAIVATALFAVGAFAASFSVEAEDTASGTDDVANCTDNVDIDFTETFRSDLNDWHISSVTVTLDAENDCAGADARLVLQDNTAGGGTVIMDDEQTGITGSVLTFPVTCASATTVCAGGTNAYLLVSQVWNAAFLLDGISFTTTS